eukprot:c22984_g3_i2 orf=148-1458(+)
MASYLLEEFVGEGVLKAALTELIRGGWDDVPTMKLMRAEDIAIHGLDPRCWDALQIRTYLHNRSLMQYAQRMEDTGKSLSELLSTSPSVLISECGMKRGHVARFIDRTTACGVVMPPSFISTARKRTLAVSSVDASSEYGSSQSFAKTSNSPRQYHPSSDRESPSQLFNTVASQSSESGRNYANRGKTDDPQLFKGVVGAAPAQPRLCGLIQPPPVTAAVAPLSALENISVQKLTPAYKAGIDPWAYRELKSPPPMKAVELWSLKPTLIFCIRRPGCVMCRAEAHQLYARKPIFDALGVQLVAVLHELIEEEVKAFWPRYWGGIVVADKNRDFFKALGGGRLQQEGFFSGFIFNPAALSNYKRAKATGIENNLKGDGTIKGGLLIMRPGKGGVAYQFVERNFGDWAPLCEVLDICGKLKQQNGLNGTTKEESLEVF